MSTYSSKDKFKTTLLIIFGIGFCVSLIFNFKLLNDQKRAEQDFKSKLNARYGYACELLKLKDYETALHIFDEIDISEKNFKDISDLKNECTYELAKVLGEKGELEQSELMLMRLPMDYEDVASRREIISNHKKFAGIWRCSDNNVDLTTIVYTDSKGVPRVRAEISDNEGILFGNPLTTLSGEGMEIFTDRFSWIIKDTDSYSFVYTDGSYKVMKQPVAEGTPIYVFEKVKSAE